MKCPKCGNKTDFNIKSWRVQCAKCGYNGNENEFNDMKKEIEK